jgi:hypothetical protein
MQRDATPSVPYKEPGNYTGMFPAEIFQSIFRCCDIDTRVALRRAHSGFAYRDGRVPVTIRLDPLTVYDPHHPGPVVLNIPFMSDNPWDTRTRRPWVMGSDDDRWWELIWGRYRVIRGYCHDCKADEYSTFTCNETDVVKPGYHMSTERTNAPPIAAKNWLGSVCSAGCNRNG